MSRNVDRCIARAGYSSQQEANEAIQRIKEEYAQHGYPLPGPLGIYICADLHYHVRLNYV